jgi:iron complex outermembrane receptor protein
MRSRRLAVVALGQWMAAAGLAQATTTQERPRDLTELSLTELANLEVISVAKRPEQRSRTPAAVTVITQQEIRRSGATSLAELLRLGPGVHAVKINSSQWAVGIRGFTSRLARSQLALVDGRSVYTPLFAGTYWEVQDTLLQDVERVEIVRGPGGTLWGANAVNGVVNVVTRSARETQGLLVSAGGGVEERAFAAIRYGGRMGERGGYRVYAKGRIRDGGHDASAPDFDEWRMGQIGFRTDWDAGTRDELTVQGDLYGGRLGQRTTLAFYSPPFGRTVERESPVSGGNLVGRWQRRLGGDSTLQVLAYYDHTSRTEANFSEARDTVDLDFQHRLAMSPAHDLVWGAGYRFSQGRTGGIETVVFEPRRRSDDLVSAFVQDEVRLFADRLRVTLGTKLERNDYSGFELQPSGRILFAPGDRHSFWGAITRAVRTPSRVEHDLRLDASIAAAEPVFARVTSSRAFDSERMYAYEAGYRAHVNPRLTLDAAAFYNRYPNLLSLEPGPPFSEGGRTFLPLLIDNLVEARTAGVEIAADAALSGRWTAHVAYSYLDVDVEPRPGSRDTSQSALEGASPRHSAVVWTAMTVRPDVDLWAALRWVDALPAQDVEAYTTLDLRLAWRPSGGVELSLVGRDLMGRHAEFAAGSAAATEVEPSVYGEVAWRW